MSETRESIALPPHFMFDPGADHGGRQEEWEDSPDGRPQGNPYGWWNLHDEYAEQGEPPPSAA